MKLPLTCFLAVLSQLGMFPSHWLSILCLRRAFIFRRIILRNKTDMHSFKSVFIGLQGLDTQHWKNGQHLSTHNLSCSSCIFEVICSLKEGIQRYRKRFLLLLRKTVMSNIWIPSLCSLPPTTFSPVFF